MEYVTLKVPQHVYEQLGLHPNKTLVLKRSENISGIDTHGNNVSTSESAETSSHCDEPVLTAAEIDDACEENEPSLQTQDGTSQAIYGYPYHAGNKVVRINYPIACGNCKQKYFTTSSYFGHLDRCRYIPRIQKASHPDSSTGLNMIPEAFHALGYDAPVLTEPEINDTPEQNESSKIIGGGIDRERCLGSTDDFDMIPEALHALSYDTPILSESEIDDVTEENDYSLPQCGGTPNNADAGKARYQNTKAEFPRPCPLREEMCDSNSGEENESSFQIHDGTSEGKNSNPSDADQRIENAILKYPRACTLCYKWCYSETVFDEHIRQCRPIGIPENSVVIRYVHGSSSDRPFRLDVAPGELALGSDPRVLAESQINETNVGTNAQGGNKRTGKVIWRNLNAKDCEKCGRTYAGKRSFNQHRVKCARFAEKGNRRITYPRVCAKCGRLYSCKGSFCNHTKRCARYVAERNEILRLEMQNPVQSVSSVDAPSDPKMNQMNEGATSEAEKNDVLTSGRVSCSDCLRDYSSKFAFKRHLRSCGHVKTESIKRVRIGDYVLPLSARIYRESRQDKLMDASEKEDKPVNWVPITTKATRALKYFVANKNSS